MKRSASLLLRMLSAAVLIGLALAASRGAMAADLLETKPADPFFAKFAPLKAPCVSAPLLKAGDRLAICGDSITQQKMYSRIIETYLTVCAPELKISVRQYGWSGETAEGFLHRMKSDCLRFQPTVATTCYGMNDYRYGPYDEATARWYRENMTAIVREFKAAGARVVVGSPSCVGKVASWVQSAKGTVEEHNLHLCALRNIDVEIARQEEVRFADVFWPMFVAGFDARKKFGADYAIAGQDGVHPGWAGHLMMAHALLKAMGLDGEIGTLTVDLAGNRAEATAGHKVDAFADGQLTITSQRYPLCAVGAADKDDSLRSGMALCPFNQELNRFTLKVKGAAAANYKVTWGEQSRNYTAAQLAEGVNLAEDFAVNPFLQAFHQVDEAVGVKQEFERRQIQDIFHGQEGKADIDAAVAKTEAQRAVLVAAVEAARTAVTHTIKIEAQ